MAYRVGEAAGPYEVLQVLGRGSFSIVFLGQDTRDPSHRVALKVVPCDHLDTRESARAKQEALAEADLLQRLRHPHIVTCHRVCWDVEHTCVWLALDFMDGGDLQGLIESSRRLAQRPLEAGFIRRMLFVIGGALVYIHSEGVLHRDVKPSNVLLANGMEEMRLADFGISKILEATHLAHTAVGTPFYLSPEIVRGEPYGPASDAWALGVCAYEMATLRRPFEAANQLALACNIVQQDPEKLPDTCPPDVVGFIASLLDKDPLSRLPLGDGVAAIAAGQCGSPSEVIKAMPMDPESTANLVQDLRLNAASSPLANGAAHQEVMELLHVVPPDPPSPKCHVNSRSLTPKARRLFGGFDRNLAREQRKTSPRRSRRRWPSLRRGLRSTLARVTRSVSPAGVALVAAELQPVSVKPISCPSGHALERYVPPADVTANCDQCGRVMELGAFSWSCRECNLDICESCIHGEATLNVVPLDSEDDAWN